MEVAEPIFNAYDTDGDGVIQNNYLSQYFPNIDLNGD